MTREETFGHFFVLGMGRRVVLALFDAAMFVLRVGKTSDLWLEESAGS